MDMLSASVSAVFIDLWMVAEVVIKTNTLKTAFNFFVIIFLSVSLDRARASTDHFFFVSRLSSVVAQHDEYLSAH